ncbi:Hsp20 family protein [Rhizobium giardinii]
MHRGLELRPFVRRFELADHVKVDSAKLESGLLIVDLTKEIPEDIKPRRIRLPLTRPESLQSKSRAT